MTVATFCLRLQIRLAVDNPIFSLFRLFLQVDNLMMRPHETCEWSGTVIHVPIGSDNHLGLPADRYTLVISGYLWPTDTFNITRANVGVIAKCSGSHIPGAPPRPLRPEIRAALRANRRVCSA